MQGHPAFPMFGLEAKPDRKAATLGEAGYERRERDAYFTEPWVTQFLLDTVDFGMPELGPVGNVIWESACGDGRMARVIEAAGYEVIATDIADYGHGASGWDFLDGRLRHDCAAIVTNPPFDTARQFILRALKLTRERGGKVAMLQRHEFDAPRINHALFEWPFAAKLILPRRPKWVDQVSKGNQSGARFPFAWFLWDWRHVGPPTLIFPRTTPNPFIRGL